MSSNPLPQSTALGRTVAMLLDYAVHYAVEILLIVLILYMCIARGLSFSVDIYDPLEVDGTAVVSDASMSGFFTGLGDYTSVFLSSLSGNVRPIVAVAAGPGTTAIDIATATEAGLENFNSVARTSDPAPHISNLTLVLSPDYGQRKGLAPEIISAKKARVQHYLDAYASIAQREMQDFGVPASITLAQGLLESNAGDSKLAVNSNNHFGIKCRKKCLGCTCRNYGDDTRYDMFRVFPSVAESFREHSKLLNTSRYAKLKAHGVDYKKWAHGLKACGYATDKRYGHKLVQIIEELDLTQYDS